MLEVDVPGPARLAVLVAVAAAGALVARRVSRHPDAARPSDEPTPAGGGQQRREPEPALAGGR
jgi:hypothetical protein